MADDAGALLVRSGLIPSGALDEARTRVASGGGTIGEHLVTAGAIADDTLTDFYRSRLLVPQVNPNTLARLPIRVVAAIPSDMAIELRAIPISLDGDNNLTIAMSDPSDSHAVDEIAFFTGAYVVRAVATQMQIAWCLAHYYGHITPLGQKLLQPAEPVVEPPTRPAPVPRKKGLTAKVQAMRHRRIAPISGPVDVARPRSDEIAVPPPDETAAALDDTTPVLEVASALDVPAPAPPETPSATDAVPDKRSRSVSGEIRVPIRRAPSIRPPMPDPLEDDSGPVLEIEADEPTEDPTGRAKPAPPRRRPRQKSNPPELFARAGEVDIATGPIRAVDDEPRIIINDEPEGPAVSGEFRIVAHRDELPPAATTIEVSEDSGVGVVIHEHAVRESEPVLLERRREASAPDDDSEVILMLEPKRRGRGDRRTQMGIGALPAATRPVRDTLSGPGTGAGGVPVALDDAPTTANERSLDDDPTRFDAYAVTPAPGDVTDETVAPPPRRARKDDDSGPVAPPPAAAAPRPVARGAAADEDPDNPSTITMVMSAVELDEAIPDRTPEVVPGHLDKRRIDYDPVDDGWGPPGTTIPPPLLGAIPGSVGEEPGSARIPVADPEDAPLIVAPPSPPEPARGTPVPEGSGSIMVRELERATQRSIDLIHALERTHTRDEVIDLMTRHLAEAHRRAGFFSIRSGELGVFLIVPRPEVVPVTTLRLDRPSTLQDVVGTRLPYRGPMHDDASRNFLAAVLGACPPEILLVPVAIRERVVGVLFGEHRMRHTFDDQLALAARAAGMAFERILKSRRG